MGFGTELKRLREKTGLSAQKMADLLDVDADRLRKWEQRDLTPRYEDRQKIEVFFGMDLDAIAKLSAIDKFLKVPNQEVSFIEKRRTLKNSNIITGIPFYDVDFAAGADIQFYDDKHMIKPAYVMDIPEFSGCVAFRAYSDSMDPLIKSGSILFGTKIDDWIVHLEYGQIYGVVCTDQRRYLKYIKKSKKESNFLLRSENKHYEDFEIPKDKIRNVWLIHGWINKRT